MANKDLKKLGRLELVDIIYALQVQNEEKSAEIKKLKARLENAEPAHSSVDVTETAEKLGQIMKETQAVTETYLKSVEKMNVELEKKREAAEKKNDMLIETAKKVALEIINEAESKALDIITAAEKDASEKYSLFRQKAAQLIKANNELNSILKGKNS